MKIQVENHHEPAGQTAASDGSAGCVGTVTAPDSKTAGTGRSGPAQPLIAMSSTGPDPDQNSGPGSDPVQTAIQAFCTVDRAMATALRALAAAKPHQGLPADRLVALAANVAGWDVAFCTRAIDCLGVMPLTWAALDDGRISWSQVRGIVTAAKNLCQADRADLDTLLTGAVDHNHAAEPERIVDIAQDLAGRLDDRRQAERDAATADRSFIRFQPTLQGGVDFFGHGDDDQIATLTAALDAAADRPVADGERPVDADGNPIPKAWLRGTARGAQLMEGLRRIAAHYLAGRTSSSPASGLGLARPALTVVVDLQTLTGQTDRTIHAVATDDRLPAVTSRLVWNLAGGRPALSTAAVRMLACDATRIPLLTNGTRLLATGDANDPISIALRRTIIARDQGCRFPGCKSPAAHTDLHHVIFRDNGGPTCPENLVALCRPHHRMTHRHNWQATLTQDGILTVTHGRYRFTSRPRLRPPPPTRTPPPADSRGDPPDPPDQPILDLVGDPLPF